ncbi:MAG: copper transporter [Actinomycetota bacterium]
MAPFRLALDLLILMINLRYHIVSLVAVFLALAIGVIAGTTVINDQLVKGLERSDRTLRNALATQQDTNDSLNNQIAMWQGWGTALATKLEKDQLRGRNVIFLIASGVNGKLLGDLQDAVATAGANLEGSVAFTAKWTLSDDQTRQQLATSLNVGPGSADDLARAAAGQLAERLERTADPNAAGDPLQTLSQAGFLTVTDQTGGTFPPPGSLLVWISSGDSNPSPPDGTFTLPLLRALVGHETVAVGEPLGSADSLSDQVRADATLTRSVPTVDHLDTILGRIALIAGLHDAASGLNAPHYGVHRGTSGPAPIPS